MTKNKKTRIIKSTALLAALSALGWILGSCGSGIDPNNAFSATCSASEVSPLWQGSKQLGVASKATSAQSVSVDALLNIYVTGNTTGGLDGNALTGNRDLFLTQYNASGARQWTRQLGVTLKNTDASGVAVDSSSNVYVAGSTTGGLDGNTLTGTKDLFVTKYDTSGVKQWTQQLGAATKITSGAGVSVDSSSNVYVSGATDGGLDGNTLTGATDLFVVKYNSAGTKQWTRQLGVASQTVESNAVFVDASSNVYVAGETDGGMDGNTLTGNVDLFVVKYDTSGVKQWTRQLGTASQSAAAYAVSVDASSNAYVAGYTTGGLDGNTLTGTNDLFVVKYDASGVKQWTRQLGVASKSTIANGVSVDASSNVYVVGNTTGGLDGNTLTGSDDLFIVKYDASGVKQWTRQLGVGSASATGRGVALDCAANAYVAGYTTGGLDGNTLTGSNDLFVTKYDTSGVKQ